MIEKTKVRALPFVDGTPDLETRPDQARVKWMRNGECMDAATSSITNEGSLNRAGVDIQKNVVQINDDLKSVNDVVSDIVDVVNVHSDILDQAGNLDLIETVQKHTDEIETLNFAVVQSDERLENIEKIAKENRYNIGVPPEHDTSGRDVRDELEFQKQEMGSYPGFDYNGMPDPDSTGTGLKNRVAQNTMQITNHQARINELETNWASSDVSSLTREVNNLRSEVGPRRDAQTGHSIYNRLGKLETAATGRDKDIQLVQEQIGFSSFPRPTHPTLVHLVDGNTAQIDELKVLVAEGNNRIAVVETKIGSELETGTILYNQKVFTADIDELYKIVGKNNSEGLRYSVVQIQNEIGDNRTPGTIKNRILLNEQGIRDLNIDISRLNDILGVDGSGSAGSFADRVDELELQMNGDPNGDTDFEKLGMYQFAFDIYQQAPIGDAPDGELYFRKKGSWSKLGDENITISDNKGLVGTKGNIIGMKDDKIVLGEAPVVVKGVLESVVIKDKIDIQIEKEEDVIKAPFVSTSIDSIDRTHFDIGSSDDVVNVQGQLLVGGIPVGQGTVTDTPMGADGMFVRENGVWKRTDEEDLPIKNLVSVEYEEDTGYEVEGSRKTLISSGEKLTIGSNDVPVLMNNVEEIRTKGLKIVDGISTVIQTTDTRVVSSRPLYVGTSKVWTDAQDAPKDGEYYARIDGAWSKIDPTGEGSGTGISDAPNDDQYYLRRNNSWSMLGDFDIKMSDKKSLSWETTVAGNYTGVSYDKASNVLKLGGSGTKLTLDGTVKDLVVDEGGSILQKSGSSLHNIIMSDSDYEIFVGSNNQTKSVTLRGLETPKAQIDGELYDIITSKDEAPIDDKTYGRKNGAWTAFEVNRTLDIILNNGYSYKVADSKGKIMTVATSGADNMIRVGQTGTLLNIDSTVRSLKLDNKVMIQAADGDANINLMGMNDSSINLGDSSKDLRISSKSATINGSKIWTDANDVPADGNKYVRQDGKWEKAYSYGSDAPSSVGAKEGDVYFQYM